MPNQKPSNMPWQILSQRHRFDIPRDIAYFNCAYMSPLLESAVEAGKRGNALKAQPWRIGTEDFFDPPDRARELFANLVGARAQDIALVPAASYALSLAAANLPLARQHKILLLEDQFPSNVYPWRELAGRNGGVIATVARAPNQSWTDAVLESLDASTDVAALPHCHWTDGALLDLESIGSRCRELNCALVLDLTQSAGAMPIDFAHIQPDFAVAACYKWLLGPYSLGFCYVAPRWQHGDPIEHGWITRAGSENFADLVNYRDELQPSAARFDMGQRAQFHLLPIATEALSQILNWGVENIEHTLGLLSEQIEGSLVELGMRSSPDHPRAKHFLGLGLPAHGPEDLVARLAHMGVHVSMRGQSLRVTPHLYNDEEDVERLGQAMRSALTA